MAIDYSIPAIPTLYNGRRYRSRLEARWAAFFDLVGWRHEYEPIDLGTWSPDFALWGRRPKFPVYVEVKPIRDWDRATARKMADAVARVDYVNCILLLGEAPMFGYRRTQLGWFAETCLSYEAAWTEVFIGSAMDGSIDFQTDADDSRFCAESRLWEHLYTLAQHECDAEWKQAANYVQWRGRDA